MSEANKGRKLKPETIAKIVAKNKGLKRSVEFCDSVRSRMTGKPSHRKGTTVSDETRSRMSEAQTGRIISYDTKLKLSEANKGSNNPGFGTMWITDGVTNARIKSGDEIKLGWRRGRTSKATNKDMK